MSSVQKKWDQIYSKQQVAAAASTVLVDNQHLLPKQGIALDLACGRGGNALFLAKQSLTVYAWDISPLAIEQLAEQAKVEQLGINSQVRDVVRQPPEVNSVDVLVVSLFLDRALCPALIKALKPGGLLFYQTYCREKVNQQQGPNNPSYLLAESELLQLFSSLKLRVYREESVLGNQQQGLRGQALLVAENR